MDTMKAARIHEYGGPEVLKYEDAPRPEAGEGEVLVRVHAVGVNPLDWKVREGYMKDWLHHKLPLILGWDLSGVVEAVGPQVTLLKLGDEVYGRPDTSRDGAYAEYIVVREAEVAGKPKTLDHLHSGGIALAGLTAWQALFDMAGLAAGQTVLIHGAAGGVGHFAVQLAKSKGAKVIGTAKAEDVDLVRELGADEVIDYQHAAFDEVVSDVDVVLDVIGGETQQRSLKVLKKGGVLVSTLAIESPEAAQERGVKAVTVMAHPDAEDLTQIAELVDAGKVKPVISTILPLSEARRAHETMQSVHTRGKIMLSVE